MRLVGKGMGEGVSVQLGCYVRFRHQRAALKQIFGRLLAQGLSGLEVMGKCLLVCKACIMSSLVFVAVTGHKPKGRERPKCNCITEQSPDPR